MTHGFEDNNGWVYGAKYLIHAKKWDIYNSEKEALLNVGYSVVVADK